VEKKYIVLLGQVGFALTSLGTAIALSADTGTESVRLVFS